jgi:Flp pilus assembly protein TadG
MAKPSRRARRLIASQDGIAALEFAMLAPALLLLIFGIVIYSIYFATLLGVRQAAAEGARAAVAGLSTSERTTLARARALEVIATYGSILEGGTPTVTTTALGTGTFAVTVSYNMSASPIMNYTFVPVPTRRLEATVTVTNGSY